MVSASIYSLKERSQITVFWSFFNRFWSILSFFKKTWQISARKEKRGTRVTRTPGSWKAYARIKNVWTRLNLDQKLENQVLVTNPPPPPPLLSTIRFSGDVGTPILMGCFRGTKVPPLNQATRWGDVLGIVIQAFCHRKCHHSDIKNLHVVMTMPSFEQDKFCVSCSHDHAIILSRKTWHNSDMNNAILLSWKRPPLCHDKCCSLLWELT